eukprot:59498_1
MITFYSHYILFLHLYFYQYQIIMIQKIQKHFLIIHILLYNYLELTQLNKENIIHVLATIIQKYDTDIDKQDAEYTVKKSKLNGKTLQKLIENDYNKLANKFSQESITKNKWQKIYNFLNNWKENQFEFNDNQNQSFQMNEIKEEEEETENTNQLIENVNDIWEEHIENLNDDYNEQKFDASNLKIKTIANFPDIMIYDNDMFTAANLNSPLPDDDDDDDAFDVNIIQQDEEKIPAAEFKTDISNHQIPRSEDNDYTKDPFPSYIFKSIWDKSDDENVEKLIDECCRKVEKQKIYWNTLKYIKMLYEDGTKLNDNDDHKTYYDFVKCVYKEAGGNVFFDEFVTKNYKREIQIWKHRMESQQQLTNKDAIFTALQKLDFKEFDFDKDYGIDFNEFQRCFKKLGYSVDRQLLREIFHNIGPDKKKQIKRNQYKQWKETKAQSLITGSTIIDKNENDNQQDEQKIELKLLNKSARKIGKIGENHELEYVVYYNMKDKRYEFICENEEKNKSENVSRSATWREKNINGFQQITHLNIGENTENDSNIKWAMYVSKLWKSKRNQFA